MQRHFERTPLARERSNETAPMTHGPITIFDKSLLQSLSLDEAVWFQNFFRSNITPLFFAETLADLEKEVAAGKSPEHVVGRLAEKTPMLGAAPNVNHHQLCIADLMGQRIQMERLPIVGQGRAVRSGDRRGLIYEQPPEMDALQRWQEGDFLGVERRFARSYRQALANLDLHLAGDFLRVLGFEPRRFRDLAAVKTWADAAIRQDGRRLRILKAGLITLGVQSEFHAAILSRWKKLGGPHLHEFAPYAAYVFGVEVFFNAAIASGHISPERPSNKMDMAYLLYLPFCMVFTSCDRLHARTAPLFLRSDQRFVGGNELKADLAALDNYYSALPVEVRNRGLFYFASRPPQEGNFLIAQLWDHLLPDWRIHAAKKEPRSPELDAKLLEEVRKMKEAAKKVTDELPVDIESADHVIIERRIRPVMGKWRILPPEAEENADK